MLGAVVFALFSFTAEGQLGERPAVALHYSVLFVPFTYAIDRFAYGGGRRGRGGARRP